MYSIPAFSSPQSRKMNETSSDVDLTAVLPDISLDKEMFSRIRAFFLGWLPGGKLD